MISRKFGISLETPDVIKTDSLTISQWNGRPGTNNFRNKNLGFAQQSPLIIVDTPKGMSLAILHALFHFAFNPFNNNQIFSIFILPNFADRIFLETNNKEFVVENLRRISSVGKIYKNLYMPDISTVKNYFCNPISLIHLHLGQFVEINNPEFKGQIAQIVDFQYEKGKVLIKILPRIDYKALLKNPHLNSQKKLNTKMARSYLAPICPFTSKGLSVKGGNISIWGRNISTISWDDDVFIGHFKYIFVDCKTIKTAVQVCESDYQTFSEGMTAFEKNNDDFVEGMNGKNIDFLSYFNTEIVLDKRDIGRPSWAQKKNKIAIPNPPPENKHSNQPNNIINSHHENQTQTLKQIQGNTNLDVSQNMNIKPNQSQKVHSVKEIIEKNDHKLDEFNMSKNEPMKFRESYPPNNSLQQKKQNNFMKQNDISNSEKLNNNNIRTLGQSRSMFDTQKDNQLNANQDKSSQKPISTLFNSFNSSTSTNNSSKLVSINASMENEKTNNNFKEITAHKSNSFSFISDESDDDVVEIIEAYEFHHKDEKKYTDQMNSKLNNKSNSKQSNFHQIESQTIDNHNSKLDEFRQKEYKDNPNRYLSSSSDDYDEGYINSLIYDDFPPKRNQKMVKIPSNHKNNIDTTTTSKSNSQERAFTPMKSIILLSSSDESSDIEIIQSSTPSKNDNRKDYQFLSEEDDDIDLIYS
ncbi:hypothetical protein TRFO_30899 [Tritrichomonas foetus]|uniref:Uncharacterized protein n=1 Tax=Tritrichomonas foetus TaxID=1144522 RepID=A0A1J4JSP9_9EUKA|nr:hypothetical protein TRFO_30899 [Tritrichomonas foetus]|eukprot:OHT02137.1 hypothetical protein TRFO_30899 [Tritrichomonas foetus]